MPKTFRKEMEGHRRQQCTKSRERLVSMKGGWRVFDVEGHTMPMIANLKKLSAVLVANRVQGKGKPWLEKMHQAQANTHDLDEEDVCSYDMFGVDTDEEPPEPCYATVNVRGQGIIFEIDSGASASVISDETLKRTWGSNLPPLRWW